MPAPGHEWSKLVAFYRDIDADAQVDSAYRRAVRGAAMVAEHVNDTLLRPCIFGWTSHLDLCVQQADIPPLDAFPYLRIAPLASGDVEFRYIDTWKTERQWRRVVPADETVRRFERFLEQLRWIGPHRQSAVHPVSKVMSLNASPYTADTTSETSEGN